MSGAHTLKAYVVAVILVMLIVLGVIRFLRGPQTMGTVAVFFVGFLMGMLAMYIAVHVYGP